MTNLVPHETRRMPRTQTTEGRGHDRGSAVRNERAFSPELGNKDNFFSS